MLFDLLHLLCFGFLQGDGAPTSGRLHLLRRGEKEFLEQLKISTVKEHQSHIWLQEQA